MGDSEGEMSESTKVPRKAKDKFTDILTQADARIAGSSNQLSETEKDKLVKELQAITGKSNDDKSKSAGSNDAKVQGDGLTSPKGNQVVKINNTQSPDPKAINKCKNNNSK